MASKKAEFYDSDDNLQRQIDVDDTTKKLHAYDSSDTDLGSLEILLNPAFGSENPVSVAGSSQQTIDKGVYYARADSGVNVEYYNGSSWIVLATPCLIVSDGSNVRFNNTNTTSANGYLTQIS